MSLSLLLPNVNLCLVPFPSPGERISLWRQRCGFKMPSPQRGSPSIQFPLVPGQVWAGASGHQGEAETCNMNQTGGQVWFSSDCILAAPLETAAGRVLSLTSSWPPTPLSPGPHGDLNAPGWSWKNIFHTLNKMCRLKVEGLLSITIWNILALFPGFIIAFGRDLPPTPPQV